MANIENLKPFTTENASYYGRRGGIASGKTRRKKALLQKQFNAMWELSNYIDDMNDTEYKDCISEFSEAEQERIGMLFRPTKKQKKELFKHFKF